MSGFLRNGQDSRRSPRRLAVLVPLLSLLGVLALAGCANREQASDQPPGSGSGSTDAYPIQVVGAAGSPVVIPHAPERIVSLNPTATEILYAIGAGGQVKAVDDQSDYPAEAPHTKLSGLTPNVEAIAEFQPDLVVLFSDSNKVAAGLDKLKVPTLLLPAARTLDEAYEQWSLLGRVTGHRAEADKLVANTKDEISRIVAATPKPARQLKYFHELDQSLYTATSNTFIGQVYGLFGLSNVADPSGSAAAGGYPQMGQQQLFSANPDLIFLADTKCCKQNAQTVAARPQWGTLNAVKNGNVIPLDDDVASRWGPRVADLVREVSHAVTRAGKTAG